ncbi:MAG TPA: DUF2062 domain-containing protein [Phycisphaerae bacterium]|nr:DUF2062 domain-containing protein [Phycisphaerae bacterium]
MPFRAGWDKAKAWFIHLLHLDESAHTIALGAAIGVFIAMTPTIGIQMMLIFFITSLLRASRVAGVPMAWITNPATIPPIYAFNLYVGALMVGGSDRMLADFQKAAGSIVSEDLPWWDLVKQWWDVVMKVALPLWVGSIVVGLVSGVAAYVIMYYLITVYRRHHRRVLAARETETPSAGDAPAAAAPHPSDDTKP